MKLLLIILAFVSSINLSYADSVSTWVNLSEGITGNNGIAEVTALASYNGNVIAAGYFNLAGGVPVNNIAQWNGTSWSTLSSGLNDTIYALTIFNGELIAGGEFTMAGGTAVNRIARWNGSTWQPLGSGINGDVKALHVYNNELYAGGEFSSPGSHIAKWNGTSWSSVGSGVDDDIFAFTIFNGDLIAAGRFDHAGGVNADKIARWDGSNWSAISGASFEERIFALAVYNNTLYAGGRFESVSSGPGIKYLAKFNGSAWEKVGNGVEDRIYALTVYNNTLVAAGQHKLSYNASDTVYSNRISSWNGSSWSPFGTGFSNKASSLLIHNGFLYAGGEFRHAGGYHASRIAVWMPRNTVTISGNVKFLDNLNPVNTGKVYALRLDFATRQLILIDSAVIGANGRYTIPNVPLNDKAIIATVADDEDFVPTYYPSAVLWEEAEEVTANTPTDSVNVRVHRVEDNSGIVSAKGRVSLNYIPFGYVNNFGLPFTSDAFVYIKEGNIFRGYGRSSRFQNYSLPPLQPGSYSIIVNRVGYETEIISLNLTSSNDSINFTLDTVKFVLSTGNEFQIPESHILLQNYPNPFNPATVIKFSIPASSVVSMRIFDSSGKLVDELLSSRNLKTGSYEINYNAAEKPSGVYFCTLQITETGSGISHNKSLKIVLLK